MSTPKLLRTADAPQARDVQSAWSLRRRELLLLERLERLAVALERLVETLGRAA
jgi:hypothetical protein